MNTLKACFKSVLAGVIGAALLALITIGIGVGVSVAQGDWRQQSEIDRLRLELDELDRQCRGVGKQRLALEMELEESNVWLSPVGTAKRTKKYVDCYMLEIDLQSKLLRQNLRYMQLVNRSVWDFLIASVKAGFLHHFGWYLLLLFAGPVVWKIFMYYIVARWIEDRRMVQLAPDAVTGTAIQAFDADLSIQHTLAAGERLYLRAGDWGKKRSDLRARTRFFWNIRYPLVSMAADLVELLELSALPGRNGSVTITSPQSDMFIARIRISGNDGVVLRPRYLVAVTDGVCIRTKWNFNIHNIVAGHIRQIVLHGSGTIFVTGSWGVDYQQYQTGQDSRIEDNLILGYEIAAVYGMCRTETFWHYFRGSTSLFDFKIRSGSFLTQNNRAVRRGDETVLEKILGAVFNGVGTMLGL